MWSASAGVHLGLWLRSIAVVEGDQMTFIKAEKGLVHRLHSELCLSHLHQGIDLLNLILSNQVSDGRVWDHHLHGQDASLSSGLREQLLGQDPFQNKGELGPDLLLLVGWKDIDDAVDRFDAGIRMQGGKGQMTGFGGGQGGLNRLEVPHLADQDNVGVLPEDMSKGCGKVLGIRVHLPLIDDAFLMAMKVFDGILNR